MIFGILHQKAAYTIMLLGILLLQYQIVIVFLWHEFLEGVEEVVGVVLDLNFSFVIQI